MHIQNTIWRWIAGGLAVAAVICIASAQGANAGPFRATLPSRFVGVRSGYHGRLTLSSLRVAKQIVVVKSGDARVSQLGRTALRIYEVGGISTAEPDAQAVEQARSGSLLTGRAGEAPSRVSFCSPTATVCDTSLPTSAGTTAQTAARQKRAAASVTATGANAMQAAAVARGEANSALSNPYIEQKVTTAESVGVNRTKIPAGGF